MTLRTCFLIVDLGHGGAQRLLAWIAPRLRERGIEVEIITLKDGPSLAPVRTLGMRGPWDLRAIPRLVGVLREFRPHILHTHLFHANVLGRLCGRLAAVPHIRSTLHTLEGPPWHRALDRLTARLADSHEFVSDAVARHSGRRGEVLRYGAPRAEVSTPVDPPFAVTASRLVAGKGIDDLIAALPKGLKLKVLGDGPDMGRLRSLADVRVEFAGWTDDVPGAMRGATAAVFPSRLGEGSPVAVLEAMMAGLPVVATDVGGTSELIEDGVTGWLVAPGDFQALAGSLARILQDPGAARAVGLRARAAALERFSIDRAVEHLDRVYRSEVPPCPAGGPG